MILPDSILEENHLRSYSDYKKLVISCAETKRSTGDLPFDPEKVEATILNAQRMKRIDKQMKLSPDLLLALQQIQKKWIWLILAEAWCGDGAQNIPYLAAMAGSTGKIHLEILLRDECPEVMDLYLTNGARSIPKLICIDAESGKELGVWGPRPKLIDEKAHVFKKEHPLAAHGDFVLNLHRLYTEDKGQALQDEFAKLIVDWAKL